MEFAAVLFVSIDVVLNLTFPIGLVSSWHTTTSAPVPMPETTVNKYDKAFSVEHKVGIARQIPTVPRESQPGKNQSLRNTTLRRCVARDNA
jgi:hypothetical protein